MSDFLGNYCILPNRVDTFAVRANIPTFRSIPYPFALGQIQVNRYPYAMRFLIPLLIILLPGCVGLPGGGLGGYQVGSRSLFGPDIQTVYVPMVEADPTRRHLAERLTEAICKQLEERSPYKVVGRPSADSVLECRIVDKKQRVSLVDTHNDPRQKNGELSVEVRWRDRRSHDIQQFGPLSLNEGVTVTASDAMVAEFGHSLLTSEQKQIDRLANQIVGMMELPW